MKIDKLIQDNDTFSEEDHFSTNASTPLRKDAFKLSDDEKIVLIQEHFKYILDTLGMDLNDDSISGTPLRVAKMYVKELFGGLHPDKKPKASIFKKSWMFTKEGKYKGFPKRTFGGDNYLGGYSDHLPSYIILVKKI